MIEIDGSESHGGGSILRLASGFSVLTQTPIKITNIRAGRPKPGLQEQHLSGIRAINNLCEGRLLGDELGSMEIEFYPKPIAKSFLDISISTAGSVGLVLQPILISCANSSHKIRIKINGGGTMGKWAPPICFLENVTFRLLEKMGFTIYMEVIRNGIYPKGGANVIFEITPPGDVKPLKIPETGNATSIKGISIDTTDLKDGRIAERQKYACQEILEKYFEGSGIVQDFRVEHINADSPGTCLAAWLETEKTILGTDMLGEKGVRAEDIGKYIANDIIRLYESRATMDEMAADQVLPFMLMAGNSIARIPKMTGHIETSIWLSEKFLGKRFSIEEGNGILIKT